MKSRADIENELITMLRCVECNPANSKPQKSYVANKNCADLTCKPCVEKKKETGDMMCNSCFCEFELFNP